MLRSTVFTDIREAFLQNLHQFAGKAPFSTWLTRIAVNESLGRLKLRKRIDQLDENEETGGFAMGLTESGPDPEANASVRELSQLLEDALLQLPEQYRTVVMMRDVEEMNTSETAAALDLTPSEKSELTGLRRN